MADIVRAPNCCRRFIGQLFSRIATGDGAPFYMKLCEQCRQGIQGTEVEVDFSDGQPLRDMSQAMLESFRATHARSWRISIINHGELPGVCQRDAVPLEGPMQAALRTVLAQACAA